MTGSDKSSDTVHLSTRDGYDKWAPTYDDGTNPMVALDSMILPALIGDVSGRDVIDLGCGTGRYATWLAREGAEATGLDGSRGMLEAARRDGDILDVRYVQSDLARDLPLRDDCCDLVLSSLVLEHLESLDGFFIEAKRVCRPDGRFIVSAMHPDMFACGVQARFDDPVTGRKTTMQSYDHSLATMTQAATAAGWSVEHSSEHKPDARLCRDFPRVTRYRDQHMLVAMVLVA